MVQWRGRRKSGNIVDVRGGQSGRSRGGRRGAVAGGSLGCGTLIVVLIAVLLGADLQSILGLVGGAQQQAQVDQQPTATPPSDDAGEFTSVILASTEDIWNQLFRASGYQYAEPRLVLYTDQVRSACGINGAATGPFYCPADQQVYIDLSFLRELQRLGAPGDFAFAYVVAHEIGHHVQTLTGVSQQVSQAQRRSSQSRANQLSVLLELQADCYAGVWAHYADQDGYIEPGDIEEGMQAAAAIGDDRLARMSGRPIQPDGFTHGTSAQRMQWFRTGYQTGDTDSCDTFR
ncbi:MAG: neutral zinc metallopeptidase [Bacteroidota bacterium]